MVSISQERQRLADVGMKLIRRETWGSRYDYRNARTVIEPARQVFVHISVTNPGAYNSHAAHVRGIEAIGIARFPSTGISYNRVIVFGVDTAYEAQPMGRRGAHTVNDHRRSMCNRFGSQCPGEGGDLTAPSWNLNYTARAYVYGSFCGASFTDSVLETMARAIAADKKAGLVARDAEIHGHRCVSYKDCPCDQVWARLHELEQRIEHYLTEEDDMPPYTDWPASDREALAADVAKAVVSKSYNARGHTVAEALQTARDGIPPLAEAVIDVPQAVVSKTYNARGHTVGQALQTARDGTRAVLGLLRAQQPLLEAAASGSALTAEEVAEVAAACAAATEGLAEDVADELGERLSGNTA